MDAQFLSMIIMELIHKGYIYQLQVRNQNLQDVFVIFHLSDQCSPIPVSLLLILHVH